jgi:hypothetical protein
MADNAEKKVEAVEVVTDKAEGKLSDLWKKEDYWAIWLGFILLAIGMIIFIPRPPENMRETIASAEKTMQEQATLAPIKTIEWYKASDSKNKVKATDQSFAKKIKTFTGKPHGWKSNPADAFTMSKGEADAKNAKAIPKYEAAQAREQELLRAAEAAQEAAAVAGYQNSSLNTTAKEAITEWRGAKRKASSAKGKTAAKPYNQLPYLIGFGIVLALFFSIGMQFMSGTASATRPGPLFSACSSANTVGTPKWVLPACEDRILHQDRSGAPGRRVLFNKIVAIGTPGIFVAWVVTPIVLS